MSPPNAPRPAAKKRLSRRRVQLVAAAAGFASFALPWVAFRVAPGAMAASTAKNQVVVVPAGSRVTVIKPVGSATNVTVVTAKGSAPAPVSTSASAAPPKI